MKNNRALLFIAKTSKREMPWMLFVTVLNAVYAALNVYFALAMRDVINYAVAGDVNSAYSAGLVFIGVVAAEIVLFFIVRLLAAKTTAKLNATFRRAVFGEIIKKDYSSVSAFHSGEIINRMFNDVAVVSDNVSTLVPNIAGLITRLLGALVAVYLVDRTFALVILCGGVGLFVFARAFRGIMKRTHKGVQEAGGRLRSFAQEIMANILVVKAFEMEKSLDKKEQENEKAYYKKKMVRAFFSTGASTGFSTIMNCGYLYAVLWGAAKILTGAAGFGYGDFTAIMQLINQIQSPFASLSGSLSRYYNAIASAERILELCDLPDDGAENRADTKAIYSALSHIKLSDVTFAYDDTEVFDSASVEIKKGELTLISGISGIGKSTMIKMLMGVLRPQSGAIEAQLEGGGSIPVDASTRSLFAYVPQGNLLMSGTIRDNMLLAKDDATDAEILDALRVASAKFFDELPEGLDTVLGERGSGLSEGQIQRLAIARAVLCGAPILLLDEATSALDEPTEREVLENIMKLPGRTCVCISHRSAAKEVCDKIIYVENGKIKTEEQI
ncbi:MAG: ABC transporter ATP-binding protein [Oscillospiraceae bacterium]|nr:ABC transporter ATP-binding protein [Oscillospiraceae bacterium]